MLQMQRFTGLEPLCDSCLLNCTSNTFVDIICFVKSPAWWTASLSWQDQRLKWEPIKFNEEALPGFKWLAVGRGEMASCTKINSSDPRVVERSTTQLPVSFALIHNSCYRSTIVAPTAK